MAIEQNWNNTKLQDCLLYGYWSPDDACIILSGLDISGGRRFEMLDDNWWIASDNYEKDLAIIKADVNRLWKFWHSDGLNGNSRYTPAFFIEWALSKRFRPAWLDWAIERELYTPKQEIITENKAQADNAVTYSTKWLEIQQAAIREFFNPRRNPDAKKDEVTEWINSQATNAGLVESENIASSIFTIIKPENHDPKKKRVEPQ